MTEHLQFIDKKLEHLERMRGYLRYSLEQVSGLMPINDWKTTFHWSAKQSCLFKFPTNSKIKSQH